MAYSRNIRFTTYNMHGYNQGAEYLKDLCVTSDVIFIQEHWLPPCGLSTLDNICNDFICFRSSAMSSARDRGIISGRPYGGVAILVRSDLAKHCRLIHKAERFIVVCYHKTIFVNVYLPCSSVSHYVDVYCDTLASIVASVNDCLFQSVVFGGDLNFDFNAGGAVSGLLDEFMDHLSLVPTYARLLDPCVPSYRHATLQASSLIDHFLVSKALMDDIHCIEIVDDGSNMSDHLPVVMLLSLPQPSMDSESKKSSKVDFQRLRWDKADLAGFYSMTYQYLSDICVPVALCKGVNDIDYVVATQYINTFYCNIFDALSCAAAYTVPLAKASFLNFGGMQNARH